MQPLQTMGTRRFGAVNWIGLRALTAREVRRFATVWTQTVLAPATTSAMFMAVFWLAFGERHGATRGDVHGIGVAAFLAPGIVMMAVIQTSFANTSSSLIVSKVQGNIVDTLMPPLSPAEILAGYTLGGMARGGICALAVAALILPASGVWWPAHPLWAAAFVLAGAATLSLAGILAGIYAEKFDQMAALTNFFITPMSFLSGTFYSIAALPEPFRTLCHANPFFYLIDGFRHGVLGVSDADPALGLGLVLLLDLALAAIAWRWLASGYRLKS